MATGLDMLKGMFASASQAYAAGRKLEADDLFYRCSRLAPNLAEIWNNLGVVRESLADYEGMVKCFEEALHHFPEGTEEHKGLLEKWKRAKELRKAKRLQEKKEREAKQKEAQDKKDADAAAAVEAAKSADEEVEVIDGDVDDDEDAPTAEKAPLRTEHGVESSKTPASIKAEDQVAYSGHIGRLKTQEEWQALERQMIAEEEYGDHGEPTDEPDGDKKLFKWFQWIYRKQDEDGRRAMNKSMCQSNSTQLTTNWSESANKEFDDCRKVEEENEERKKRGLRPKPKEKFGNYDDDDEEAKYDDHHDRSQRQLLKSLKGPGDSSTDAPKKNEVQSLPAEAAAQMSKPKPKGFVTNLYDED